MSIDNLLRIEITLSNIYYRLLMLEIYGEVESGEYTTNLKMLLNMLKEESKILDSYTIEELEVIKESITGKRIETNIDNIFIYDIINRLEKNIIRLLESKRTEKLNNNVRKKVLEVYNLMSLVEFERTDIYLSFLDEEIKELCKNYPQYRFMLYYKIMTTLQQIGNNDLLEKYYQEINTCIPMNEEQKDLLEVIKEIFG